MDETSIKMTVEIVIIMNSVPYPEIFSIIGVRSISLIS